MKARGKEESSLFTGYARLSIGSQTGVTLNFSKAQPLDQNPVTVSTAMSGASTGGNAPVASQKADDQYSTPIPSQSKGDGDIHKCPTGGHDGDCRQSALPSRSPEASASISREWNFFRRMSSRNLSLSACDPREDSNVSHHIQIGMHRDANGVVTHDWVNFDGTHHA